MTKQYMKKSYLEKNSQDKEKLSKEERRLQQKSYRQAQKTIVKRLLDESEEVNDSDKYYELEMQMAELCYLLSEMDSNYKCTCICPNNIELASEHINYLRQTFNSKVLDSLNDSREFDSEIMKIVKDVNNDEI